MSGWNQGRFASLERVRDKIKSTFWVVPAACVLASIVLAAGLIRLDQVLGSGDGAPVFYPGPPEGARSLLSSIVGAMISFTGLVFSITIVVLQLTSGQFSPRSLRIFLRDRTVRFALGIFMATFVYAMVVQRAVLGTTSQGAFVPRIAVSAAFVFVLASVGLFIGYLSRISDMIRVATIITEIGMESRAVLRRRFDSAPHPDGPEAALPVCGTILAAAAGVVVSVNEERLVQAAAAAGRSLELAVRVGDFVPAHAVLCMVRRAHDGADDDVDTGAGRLDGEVRAHVALDSERTSEQDLAFALRQLVDIAERALSPAVNDPTTACQCLDVLHDILRRLASRPLPDGRWTDDGGTERLVVPQYSYADYLDLAVGEIWHYGADAAQVPSRMASMLADLATAALPVYQADIRRWSDRIESTRKAGNP